MQPTRTRCQLHCHDPTCLAASLAARCASCLARRSAFVSGGGFSGGGPRGSAAVDSAGTEDEHFGDVGEEHRTAPRSQASPSVLTQSMVNDAQSSRRGLSQQQAGSIAPVGKRHQQVGLHSTHLRRRELRLPAVPARPSGCLPAAGPWALAGRPLARAAARAARCRQRRRPMRRKMLDAAAGCLNPGPVEHCGIISKNNNICHHERLQCPQAHKLKDGNRMETFPFLSCCGTGIKFMPPVLPCNDRSSRHLGERGPGGVGGGVGLRGCTTPCLGVPSGREEVRHCCPLELCEPAELRRLPPSGCVPAGIGWCEICMSQADFVEAVHTAKEQNHT